VLTWLPQRDAKSLEDDPVLPKKRQELGQLLVTPPPPCEESEESEESEAVDSRTVEGKSEQEKGG
jgi:hypothetical protein